MKAVIRFAVKNVEDGLGGKFTHGDDLDGFEINVSISNKEWNKLEEYMDKDYHLNPRENTQVIVFRGIDFVD